MQQITRDMQAQGQTGASLNGIVASADQIALSEMQNGHSSQAPFDHGGSVGHDDFLDQMLSGLRSPWAELGTPKAPWDAPDSEVVPAAAQRIFGVGKEAEEGLQYASFDESTLLANRLRQYQISRRSSPVGKAMVLPLSHHGQQQMLANSGDSGFLPLPLTLGSCGSSDSPNPTVGDGLYNGFSGALQHTESANQHTFPHPQSTPVLGQNFGAAPLAPGLTQAPAAAGSASAGGGTGAPRQKVRARRGQATDPHSIAERLRRERIAERMKALQELVPNANKTDKASMLDEIIDYVKFLQLQVKVLSMSRLGGAAAVAPLVADMSSEGQSGAGRAVCAAGGSSDSLTVTEHQVAKLMEEDMGSAMQYLQGKGLCLMPISLASAISSAASSFHRPLSSSSATHGHLHPLPNASSCDAPSSPAASALSAHSAMANAAADAAKDTVVVSKA